MLPTTVERTIRDNTVRNIAKYRGAPPQAITRRLAELDGEWDVNRTVTLAAAAAALAGLALGTLVHRRFHVVSAAACGVLLEHALTGWSLPVPWLRRRGLRTPHEIEAERRVLQRMKARAS